MQFKNSKIYRQRYAGGYAIAIDTFDEREFEQIKNLFENFSDHNKSLILGCYRGYYYYKYEDLIKAFSLYYQGQLFLEGKFKYEKYSRRKRNTCIRKEKVVDYYKLINRKEIKEQSLELAKELFKSIEEKKLYV